MIHALAARIPRPRLAISHGTAAEAVQVIGFGSASYGAWLLNHPAGFIAAGLLLVAEAFSLERSP